LPEEKIDYLIESLEFKLRKDDDWVVTLVVRNWHVSFVRAYFRPEDMMVDVTFNGIERGLITVNRQLPGPPIQVCKNDVIVVDVKNHMEGGGASIHWHGMTQKGTPFADGVPFLTLFCLLTFLIWRFPQRKVEK
jgi:Multicopper oxidase